MTTQHLMRANVLVEGGVRQEGNYCTGRMLESANVEMPLCVASSMELLGEKDLVDTLYREGLAWLIADACREVVKHML